MFRSVVNDDRRAIIVGTEVEPGAGILPDVDLVGELPDLSPCQLAARPRILDLSGYLATPADLGLGMRHREPRDR